MTRPCIVIVDDDVQSALLLVMLLNQMNFEGVVYHDPLTASTAIPELPSVQAIFLDLEMDRLTAGGLLLTALRKSQHLARVPIVAYTAHLSEMAWARQMGFDGFLGKPIRQRDFSAQMRALLAGEGIWSVRE